MTTRRAAAVCVWVAFIAGAACSQRPSAPALTNPPAIATGAAMAVGHGRAQPPTPPGAVAPSPPAKGGMSVADIWKSRATLAGRKVTVRGKVVKYNGGILGVNWIHLQDGSGTAEDGTNDITVTSEAEAKIGDLITVTGVVTLDKDLGAGYRYPVIIEHATIDHATPADR